MAALRSPSAPAAAASSEPPAAASPAPAEQPAPGGFFSLEGHAPAPAPTSEAWAAALPRPILDANPEWIALHDLCWEIAGRGIKSPEEGSPLVSPWLDEAFSENIFQWDTIFMTLFARYTHAAFPGIQSLDNFYALQRPEGYICREFRERDGLEISYSPEGGLHDPKARQNTINPPLFAWAEVESWRVTGDASRYRRVLPALAAYAAWLDRPGDPAAADWLAQGRRSAGAVHSLFWNTPLGSGMDNSPRPADLGAGWVEMSAQMVIMFNNLAVIADALDQSPRAAAWRARAQEIGAEINRWCWDDDAGFYFDVRADGTRFAKKTSGGFWPLLAGIASPEQAARLAAHLENPAEFWRPVPFPTLAADEPEYVPRGQYWLGSVWAPTNVMIIKGLERYGLDDLAARAAERHLAAMAVVHADTGTVWENYAPELPYGQGSWSKPDFVGWTGCGPINILYENILGLRPNAAAGEILWKLRRTDRHGIANLRVGAATVSLICEARAAADAPAIITASATEPIRLRIIHPGGERAWDLGPEPRRLLGP